MIVVSSFGHHGFAFHLLLIITPLWKLFGWPATVSQSSAGANHCNKSLGNGSRSTATNAASRSKIKRHLACLRPPWTTSCEMAMGAPVSMSASVSVSGEPQKSPQVCACVCVCARARTLVRVRVCVRAAFAKPEAGSHRKLERYTTVGTNIHMHPRAHTQVRALPTSNRPCFRDHETCRRMKATTSDCPCFHDHQACHRMKATRLGERSRG